MPLLTLMGLLVSLPAAPRRLRTRQQRRSGSCRLRHHRDRTARLHDDGDGRTVRPGRCCRGPPVAASPPHGAGHLTLRQDPHGLPGPVARRRADRALPVVPRPHGHRQCHGAPPRHPACRRRTPQESSRTAATCVGRSPAPSAATVRGSSLATFRTQAAQTLGHARGWGGGGARFRRVASGGDFMLARAGRVPSCSSACSARHSCRVGRNVLINEGRWKAATRAWHATGRSLRDDRTMVVNHEVGHVVGCGTSTARAGTPRADHAAAVEEQEGLHAHPLAASRRSLGRESRPDLSRCCAAGARARSG